MARISHLKTVLMEVFLAPEKLVGKSLPALEPAEQEGFIFKPAGISA